NYDFSIDYCYNDNLGDYTGIVDPNNPDYNAGKKDWGKFKKRNQVPGNVLMATDASSRYPQFENSGKFSDDRFDFLGGLTHKFADGGSPHGTGPQSKRKGNALFHDGTVRLVRVFSPKEGTAIFPPTSMSAPSYTSPGYENTVSVYTDLRDWMICDPG